ncbi:ATP-binding protein [Halomonadaceae bacterium KBTZ08]
MHHGGASRYRDVAAPIVDRIIHHSHIFMLGGENSRLKQKKSG